MGLPNPSTGTSIWSPPSFRSFQPSRTGRVIRLARSDADLFALSTRVCFRRRVIPGGAGTRGISLETGIHGHSVIRASRTAHYDITLVFVKISTESQAPCHGEGLPLEVLSDENRPNTGVTALDAVAEPIPRG